MEPKHVPGDSGERADIGASHIRVILSEPGIGAFEENTDPGGGPPLHIHHDADEIFRVIEGSFRFVVGETRFDAGPGDVLTVPRGAAHTFVNLSETRSRLFILFQPGGCEGFFRAFAAKGLRLPDDMAEIVRLAESFQLEFLGPNPLVEDGA